MMQAEWSNNHQAKQFFCRFQIANYAKCVFSWPAWFVYGFAIATKSSKVGFQSLNRSRPGKVRMRCGMIRHQSNKTAMFGHSVTK